MNIDQLISIIASIGSLILGLISLVKTSAKKIKYSFFLLTLALNGWIITLSLFYSQDPHIPILYLGRLNFAFGLLIGYFALCFIYFFPRIFKNFRFISKIFVTSWTIFLFIVTIFTNLIDKGETSLNGQIVTQFGSLYFIYVVTFFFYIGYGIYLLIKKYLNLYGIYKKQISYFLVGFLLATSSTIISNIILPLLGNFNFQKVSPFFTLFFLSFTLYAIIRYRLLNIKLILTRSLVYVILVAIVSAGFVFISTFVAQSFQEFGLNQYLVWAAFALMIVVGLDPLKNLFARLTDKVFFKDKIDYNVELKRLSNIINEEIELDWLIRDFTIALKTQLKLERTDILIAADEERVFLPLERYDNTPEHGSDEDKKQLRLYNNSPFIRHLRKNKQTVVTDEFDRYIYDLSDQLAQTNLTKVLNNLEELQAGAVMPIVREGKMNGILVVGAKVSGETFSTEDVNLFEVLASQLAAALERSKLYQEVQVFNVKLQKEVEKATGNLKKANLQLKDANTHLLELDQAKSEFMSIASHQLRTPLTGIVGYLSMVLEGDYGTIMPEQVDVMKDVYQASQRLVRLVNMFLNVTRIEAGRFTMTFVKSDLAKLVKTEVHDLMPTAEKKGVKLEFVEPPSGTILEAMVDQDKMGDVILNLVDNAIKYTETGTIIAQLKLADNNQMEFTVTDTGVGIDPKDADNLFQKFVRGSGIARIQPNGSGLGLYIVKKIVEGHHGKVWVESKGLNLGSVFHVLLPIEQKDTSYKAEPETLFK